MGFCGQSTECRQGIADLAAALLPGRSLANCLVASNQRDCGVLQSLSGVMFEALQTLQRTPDTVPVITVHRGFVEELGRALRGVDAKGFGATCLGK